MEPAGLSGLWCRDLTRSPEKKPEVELTLKVKSVKQGLLFRGGDFAGAHSSEMRCCMSLSHVLRLLMKK